MVVAGVLWVTVEGEGGEGPCEYVGKRGRTPMNDVFVEEEIDS